MTAFRYPAASRVRRHGPRGDADADSYRPWLRDEFAFRCVYCLFREQWGRVKAAFTLDHFVPTSIAPKKERTYDNLLYARAACNAAKGSSLLPDPTLRLGAYALLIHGGATPRMVLFAISWLGFRHNVSPCPYLDVPCDILAAGGG